MPKDTHHEIFVAVTASIIVFASLASLIVYTLLFYQKKKFVHRQAMQEMEKQYKEELLQTQIETQEHLMQQLSQELHDNLGQIASLIKINLTTINTAVSGTVADQVSFTKELTRQMIKDIKALSVKLNSDRINEVGLVKMLEDEVEKINKTQRFQSMLEVNGDVPELNGNDAIILYRIIQESINNSLKHSDATTITFKLSGKNNLLILSISDDGKGFNIEEKMRSGGSGLHNFYKRVALIRGKLTLESEIGAGTTMTVILPL